MSPYSIYLYCGGQNWPFSNVRQNDINLELAYNSLKHYSQSWNVYSIVLHVQLSLKSNKHTYIMADSLFCKCTEKNIFAFIAKQCTHNISCSEIIWGPFHSLIVVCLFRHGSNESFVDMQHSSISVACRDKLMKKTPIAYSLTEEFTKPMDMAFSEIKVIVRIIRKFYNTFFTELKTVLHLAFPAYLSFVY